MPGVLAALATVASAGALALAVPSAVVAPSTPPAVARPAAAMRAGGSSSAGTPPLVARRPGGVGATVPRSRFRWPLDPRPHLLRRFAVGPQPWSPGHRGVDLAASAGQLVLAAGAGVVTFTGKIAGVGVVSVGHGQALRTTYEPVEAEVHVGDHVRPGDQLGTLSTWPGHCDACLHWGAIRGETYVDPLQLLGLVPPVLLPLGR